MGAGHEGAGKTLGLVGFGSIGQVTAAKARALGFATIAADAFLPESDPAWRATERVVLPALLVPRRYRHPALPVDPCRPAALSAQPKSRR